MTEPSLWHRLKQARLMHVAGVYLAAAWLVLQIADTLTSGLGLPPWIFPAALILLLVGLVVILATAWVQSLPSTTERERAGTVPGDWSIAPRAAVRDLLRGRIPHPTWARAIAGGVVMLALLFGGAGLHVVMSDNHQTGSTPPRAAAADAIAVVPFDVTGADLEIWREGMMDLLANAMDGVGGFRTIDTRTVMARWRDESDGFAGDLPATLRVAAATGARYVLTGSVVSLGGDVRIVTNVHDVLSSAEVAQGRVQGPADAVLDLADELAVATVRDLLRSVGRETGGRIEPADITTTSLTALRAFLQGEAMYRRGHFADAVAGFEQAVAEDSTFATAWARLSEAYAWLPTMEPERYDLYATRARETADRLPPRQRVLVEGWKAFDELSAAGVPALKAAALAYPDDPDIWFLIVESIIHIGEPTHATFDELWDAAQRAVALDPGFAPYLLHHAELAVLAGDREAAEASVRRYEELSGDSAGMAHVKLAIPLLLGDPLESASALEAASALPLEALGLYLSSLGRWHDRADLDRAVHVVFNRKRGHLNEIWPAMYDASMGRLRDGAALVAGPTLTPSDRATWWAYAAMLWDVGPPGPDDPGGPLRPEDCDDPAFDPVCHVFVGVAAAGWRRPDLSRYAAARLRHESASAPTDGEGSGTQLNAYADVVQGAWQWRNADRRRGRELLERWAGHGHNTYVNWEGSRARIELAWLEMEENRPAEAIRHLRGEALMGWDRPMAFYGLARAYGELGMDDQARYWYGRLAAITHIGDDLTRIREARQALMR